MDEVGTHHLINVSVSFFGQIDSSKLPSSVPSPSPSRGICSTSLLRICRWTDDLMLVEVAMSSLGRNLGGGGRDVGQRLPTT